MARKKPPIKRGHQLLSNTWDGETGFRLGDITEADMRQLAGGNVPPWLQRTAGSLLTAQKKWTIKFEPQEPGIREEKAS